MKQLKFLNSSRSRFSLFCALIASASLVACAAVDLKNHSPAVNAPNLDSMESRIAAQNALFEEYYQADLEADPERATAYGDYRYNDRLDDVSVDASIRHHQSDEKFLVRLKALSVIGFPEQDKLSHEVLMRTLEQHAANFSFHEYEMPVNQMDGPHVHLADLPLAVPFENVRQYEDYIARLHQIPRVFKQTTDVLRVGMQDHLMPVRFLLEKIPDQCRGIIAANPFLLPTQKYPSGISREDQERLTKLISETVSGEVLPAYRAFADFIAATYAPSGRKDLSVTSLPGGVPRYLNAIRSRTTISDLSPDQIHQIGLREMARIQGEMLGIARHEGFADLESFRAAVKSNKKYQPISAEQIVEDFRKYLTQMQPKLSELFGFIPPSPVTVEAIPAFQAAMATHYQTGTPDGKRPGRISVATSNFAKRSLANDEAIAYHEGIPGHHMQQSVAQLSVDLPKFRKHSANSGYIEGWALYAEQLGKEIGFYRDPVSDYGRLSSELFRAVRLVVDTGIHAQGWTRDQVVDYFRKSGAVDEPTLQSEADRYIAWPAQALSYKLGQLKFLELRTRARQELGTRFDIRKFHDEMLNGGVLPLDLLELRTTEWIRQSQLSMRPIANN